MEVDGYMLHISVGLFTRSPTSHRALRGFCFVGLVNKLRGARFYARHFLKAIRLVRWDGFPFDGGIFGVFDE